MSVKDLRDMLERLEDTREIVLHAETAAPAPWLVPELRQAWLDARAEARDAYADWCAGPGPDAAAVYRAAEERADAAWTAMAAAAAARRRAAARR